MVYKGKRKFKRYIKINPILIIPGISRISISRISISRISISRISPAVYPRGKPAPVYPRGISAPRFIPVASSAKPRGLSPPRIGIISKTPRFIPAPHRHHRQNPAVYPRPASASSANPPRHIPANPPRFIPANPRRQISPAPAGLSYTYR